MHPSWPQRHLSEVTLWSSTALSTHASATGCYKTCQMQQVLKSRRFRGLWCRGGRGQCAERSGRTSRGAGRIWVAKSEKPHPAWNPYQGWGGAFLICAHRTVWNYRDPPASQGLRVSWDRGQTGSRATLLLISGLLPSLPPIPSPLAPHCSKRILAPPSSGA